MCVPGYFGTAPQDVTASQSLDMEAAISDFLAQVEHWNSRGSGFVLERITKFVVCISKFRPMHVGSSYIETPSYIAKKHCVTNIKNTDDKCFVWSVLCGIYKPQHHPSRITHYTELDSSLHLKGLTFPLNPRQIPLFERLNPTVSVNVFSLGEKKNEFCVEHLSREKGRQHHVNLLLLSDELTGKRHYTCITDMSRLVGGRTATKRRGHVCCSCLHVFSSADRLSRHEPECSRHPPQMVSYPDPNNPDKCTVKFCDLKKQHRIPFYLAADFECFIQPVDDLGDDGSSSTLIVDEHNVCGFACYRVTPFEQHQTPPTVYSGDDVMAMFYEHVMAESDAIDKIIANGVDMLPLTERQQSTYDEAECCVNCGERFTANNWKCRHHCHISGEFLFPACNRCNLQLKMTATKRRHRRRQAAEKQQKNKTEKMKKTNISNNSNNIVDNHNDIDDDDHDNNNSNNNNKRRKDDDSNHSKRRRRNQQHSYDDDADDDDDDNDDDHLDDDDDFDDDGADDAAAADDDDDDNPDDSEQNKYYLPIIFHNLKNYDGHFIIKHFEKKYVEKQHSNKTSYDDIKMIPLNTERYLTFQIGNIRFLDSYQFLSTSLDNLVSVLLKAGKDRFHHTTKHLGDDELVFAKGVYPYSYMQSQQQFQETVLPPNRGVL